MSESLYVICWKVIIGNREVTNRSKTPLPRVGAELVRDACQSDYPNAVYWLEPATPEEIQAAQNV